MGINTERYRKYKLKCELLGIHDGFEYECNEEKDTIKIVSYNGKGGDVEIQPFVTNIERGSLFRGGAK